MTNKFVIIVIIHRSKFQRNIDSASSRQMFPGPYEEMANIFRTTTTNFSELDRLACLSFDEISVMGVQSEGDLKNAIT